MARRHVRLVLGADGIFFPRAGCPATSRLGRLSTSRLGADWRLTSSRNGPTIDARCCAWTPAEARNRAPPSSTARPCATPESGEPAGYDGAKRKSGSKVHLAVDTVGHLLALHATPANADDCAQVGRVAQAVQAATRGAASISPMSGDQARLRSAAAAMGGGALLRLGDALPPPRQGLRALFPARSQISTASPSSASCSNRPRNSRLVHISRYGVSP